MGPAANISRGERLAKQNIKTLLISEMNGEELKDSAQLSQTAGPGAHLTFVSLKAFLTLLPCLCDGPGLCNCTQSCEAQMNSDKRYRGISLFSYYCVIDFEYATVLIKTKQLSWKI